MVNDSGNPELIRVERDYYINYVKIVAFNGKEYPIDSQIIEMCYHENIATISTYLSITLFDTVDFPTLLPMIGEERIKISFTRQDEKQISDGGGLKDPIVLDMPVYKITKRSPESKGKKSQVYTLHAASDEMLQSLKTKVRLGLKSRLYSEMVEQVYNEYVKISKEIQVEPTQYPQDFCIANMNPFRFISHISGRSISPTYGGCLYFFYEDRDKYNFRSLGSMFEAPTTLDFNFAVKGILKAGSDNDPKSRNFERDVYSVEYMEHKQSFDLIKTILTGSYSQKAIFFDPIRRVIKTQEFDIDEEWETLPHIEKTKPFTPNNKAKASPDCRMSLYWTNAEHNTVDHINSKESEVNPFKFEEYVLRTSSQLDTMMRNTIDAVLPGTPDIKAGITINFKLPEHLGKVSPEEPEEMDAYLQGKYLVISVMHRIAKGEYTCGVTLAKDSFFSDIKHRDPHEEYPIGKYM
jgi:hypothetical protein